MRIHGTNRLRDMRKLVSVLTALSVIAIAPVCAPRVSAAPPVCTPITAADGKEPVCNPFLADSPWPGSQRGSYAQHSSPLRGVTGPVQRVGITHQATASVPVVLSFSPTYPDGNRVIWASTVGVTGEVLKIDAVNAKVIDKYIPPIEGGGGLVLPGVSGAYALVDADNHLIVGIGNTLRVYGDARPGQRNSPIALLATFQLPAQASCGNDALVGINMTYGGRVAFATQNGVVGTVPRTLGEMTAANVRTSSINRPNCASLAAADREQVSNSISSDETGGIYVVTSNSLYRFDDNAGGLTQTWRSAYAGAGQSGAGSIGSGSGSTPSLMGTNAGDDRFVVITDGQKQVHLDLMWRDQIPADWAPIRPGADRRIACEVPITFGQAPGTPSLNEQSVLIRGNSAVLVNNLQGYNEVLSKLPAQLSIYTQLLSGLPGNAPRGVERVDWDPATKKCNVVWSNATISIPNGIPTMSAADGMVYGVGVRNGVWTLEGLDFGTGQSKLIVPTTGLPTSNSVFAAATIGSDGSVWTGTLGGVTHFRQCAVGETCERLGLIEAVVGNPPLLPNKLLPYLVGVPNR